VLQFGKIYKFCYNKKGITCFRWKDWRGQIMSEKIGYLLVDRFENGNYTGGIMITDRYGIPREFKYTEPIRPTKLQKILYGKALERYIKNEVIVKNLISKIENTPSFYFVKERELSDFSVELKRLFITINVSMDDPGKEVGSVKQMEEGEFIVRISPTEIFRCYSNALKSSEQIKKFVDSLQEFSKTLDLLEPFTRVEEALHFICKPKS